MEAAAVAHDVLTAGAGFVHFVSPLDTARRAREGKLAATPGLPRGRWCVMTAAATCHVPSGSGGQLAQLGRATLRTDMTTPALPDQLTGCQCGRCAPPPLNDIEAQAALRHVSNAGAVAFARGHLALVSHYGCDRLRGLGADVHRGV